MQTFVFYHYILFLQNERRIWNITENAIRMCSVVWSFGKMDKCLLKSMLRFPKQILLVT